MKNTKNGLCFIGLLASLGFPAFATVSITSITPSPQSPQPIGTSITWTVKATDSHPGPLTFQFSVGSNGHPLLMVRDFNVGTLASGVWTSPTFVWAPTGFEGTYHIQVVIKDFKTGESATKSATFQVNPIVTGTAPVVKAASTNPLVAYFGAPSCPTGSSMRARFQQVGKSTFTVTNFIPCHPPATMNFEIAGMYPSSTYHIVAQTRTGTSITNSSAVSFTTGALPTSIPFPTFTVSIPPGTHTETTDDIILHNLVELAGGAHYPDVATDLAGKIIWYYYAPSAPQHYNLLTRPLPNGNFLAFQNGTAWNPETSNQQLLREFDLAGNIVRETNTGALQQALLAKGVTDAQACDAVPSPPPVGAACLNAFHHEAIQSLPGGYTAAFVSIEKIFPPGTQGDTSGLPVDIIGDMIVVLDANWQVAWYFDTFQHDSGAPQLDINRPSVLPNTCVAGQTGCPPVLLLGTGVSRAAQDWLHANSIYYWPQTKDIIWSSKNQNWVMKIDYNNGTGTGNILWRMGLDGDFTFNNINNDPYPWFSGQHEVNMENAGAGPLSLFDNGVTRVAPPPHGVGSGNSRAMVLNVNESNMTVTPVMSQDLGVYTASGGSMQLLTGGNYFTLAAVVVVTLSNESSFSIQLFPTAGTTNASQVLNMAGPTGYRAWQLPSLYAPPTS